MVSRQRKSHSDKPQAPSTFVLPVGIPKRVGKLSRKDFFESLWKSFGTRGLLGIHEGTLLSEEAASEGLETDSWTVDSGEAPRERDWVDGQSLLHAELYFESLKAAKYASGQLEKLGLSPSAVREQKEQDWDAEWKASFQGMQIPPHWQVLPPWVEAAAENGASDGGAGAGGAASGGPGRLLRINPGAGFGTGTHETTRLCLQALAENWTKMEAACGAGTAGASGASATPLRVLDFGSGSGILSIGAALLGGRVDGVEIDPLAIENADENAHLNGFECPSEALSFSRELSEVHRDYDVILANILKPVLLEFAETLVARLKKGRGTPRLIILSGLIASDVPAVSKCYRELLGLEPQVLELNEWRALVFKSF